MSTVRINDLARELAVKSKTILAILPLVGVTRKKTHSSSIDAEEAERVRGYCTAHREEFSFPSGVRPGSDAKRPRAEWHHISKPGDVLKALIRKTAPESTDTGKPPSGPVMSSLSRANIDVAKTVSTLARPDSTQSSRIVADASKTLILPESFTFYSRGFADFEQVLQYFDWTPRDSLTIDLTACLRSNFQTVALLVQYAWYRTINGCVVTFRYGAANSGLTSMLATMGALDWRVAHPALAFTKKFLNWVAHPAFLRRGGAFRPSAFDLRPSVSPRVPCPPW